jgi:hypothetical protein
VTRVCGSVDLVHALAGHADCGAAPSAWRPRRTEPPVRLSEPIHLRTRYEGCAPVNDGCDTRGRSPRCTARPDAPAPFRPVGLEQDVALRDLRLAEPGALRQARAQVVRRGPGAPALVGGGKLSGQVVFESRGMPRRRVAMVGRFVEFIPQLNIDATPRRCSRVCRGEDGARAHSRRAPSVGSGLGGQAFLTTFWYTSSTFCPTRSR